MVWIPRYNDADSATCVCTSCNLRIAAEGPSLHQRTPKPVGSHGVLHNLVFVKDHYTSPLWDLDSGQEIIWSRKIRKLSATWVIDWRNMKGLCLTAYKGWRIF